MVSASPTPSKTAMERRASETLPPALRIVATSVVQVSLYLCYGQDSIIGFLHWFPAPKNFSNGIRGSLHDTILLFLSVGDVV